MSADQKHTEAFEKNARQLQYAQPYPPQYYPQQQQMQVVQGQYPVVVSAAPQSAQFNTVSVIRDHLVWSIFNLLLLCPVLGIIALIFSILSRSAITESRWEDARSHGQVAFGLNVAGTVLGVLGWIIIIISLALFGTVYGGVMKTFGDIEGDFVTLSDDWYFPTTPTTVW